MSNDTGISVEYHEGKWQVLSVNMSSDFKSLMLEYDTRAEAIEAAAEEGEWPVEYGIIHIDAEESSPPGPLA